MHCCSVSINAESYSTNGTVQQQNQCEGAARNLLREAEKKKGKSMPVGKGYRRP